MEIAKEKGDEIQNGKQNSVPGKSCKGCVFYSSALKSKSLNPRCVGISRSVQVYGYADQSKMEASERSRNMTDFKYGCLGYSLFINGNGSTTKDALPSCIGLELFVDKAHVHNNEGKNPAAADVPAHVAAPIHNNEGKNPAAADVPAHVAAPIHNNEDSNVLPRPRMPQPANTTRDDFRTRFIRNAGLVSAGVGKNLIKVGNRVKNNLEEILYPYRSNKPK